MFNKVNSYTPALVAASNPPLAMRAARCVSISNLMPSFIVLTSSPHSSAPMTPTTHISTKVWEHSSAFPNAEYFDNKPLGEFNRLAGAELLPIHLIQERALAERQARSPKMPTTKVWQHSAAFPNGEYFDNKPLGEFNRLGGAELLPIHLAQERASAARQSQRNAKPLVAENSKTATRPKLARTLQSLKSVLSRGGKVANAKESESYRDSFVVISAETLPTDYEYIRQYPSRDSVANALYQASPIHLAQRVVPASPSPSSFTATTSSSDSESDYNLSEPSSPAASSMTSVSSANSSLEKSIPTMWMLQY